jgi:hypothetical protein
LAPASVAGGGDDNAESVVVEGVGSLGAALAPNTREAYRYRIRRKRAIADLVLQLTELYEVRSALFGLLCLRHCVITCVLPLISVHMNACYV